MLMIVFRAELLTGLRLLYIYISAWLDKVICQLHTTLYLPLADFTAATSLPLTNIENKQISPELLIDRFLMWPSGSWAHLYTLPFVLIIEIEFSVSKITEYLSQLKVLS